MLTTAELERRRQFITATDVPAILGVSPYKNALDVWVEKTQALDPWGGNDATTAGTLLEPSILAWARTQLGPINEGDWRVHQDGILAATLDGILPNGEIVECKSHGIVGPANWSAWGAEGSDEIPDVYAVQVQVQMLVTGAARAWVPALIGGRGFVMFCVQAHPLIHEHILKSTTKFWDRVLDREPPDIDETIHLETVKRMQRIAGKSVPLSDDLVAAYQRACEIAKEADAAKKSAHEALLMSLGDAEIGVWSGGEYAYTEVKRAGYTVEPTSYRQLRARKVKEAATV